MPYKILDVYIFGEIMFTFGEKGILEYFRVFLDFLFLLLGGFWVSVGRGAL